MRDWFEKNLDMLIRKQEHSVEAVKLEYLLQRQVIATSSSAAGGVSAARSEPRELNTPRGGGGHLTSTAAAGVVVITNPFEHQTHAEQRRIHDLIKY